MLPPAAMLVATLLLASCMPGEPAIAPVPEPSSTPVFASDEEALAAATAAYAKYLEVSDAIFASGGTDVDALSEVLTGDQLEIEKDGFATVEANAWHSTGSTTFDQFSLQQYDKTAHSVSIVVAYVCEDISGTDVVDDSGNSVRAQDLPERSLYEVTFDLKPGTPILLVSGRDLWESGGC